MAWEWSHSTSAYEYAYERVMRLRKRDLVVILGEWQYHDMEQAQQAAESLAFDTDTTVAVLPDPSFELPASTKLLSRACLANLVWERAEAHRTCTNGGWDCYVCPDGCHTVPFGSEVRS